MCILNKNDITFRPPKSPKASKNSIIYTSYMLIEKQNFREYPKIFEMKESE